MKKAFRESENKRAILKKFNSVKTKSTAGVSWKLNTVSVLAFCVTHAGYLSLHSWPAGQILTL